MKDKYTIVRDGKKWKVVEMDNRNVVIKKGLDGATARELCAEKNREAE